MLGLVMHTHVARALLEAEATGSQVQDQPGQLSETSPYQKGKKESQSAKVPVSIPSNW